MGPHDCSKCENEFSHKCTNKGADVKETLTGRVDSGGREPRTTRDLDLVEDVEETDRLRISRNPGSRSESGRGRERDERSVL